MKKIDLLCYAVVVLTVIVASVGIFYTTGSDRFTVKNIYEESIVLYGDGIYKYNSILKAGANKGTDLVMLIVAINLAIFTAMKTKAVKYNFLQVGSLAGLLYYSCYLAFGVTFNRLFPIYLLLFSSSLFAMVFLLTDLIKKDNLFVGELVSKSLKGTALFLIISGSSVLIWLEFIVPALINGQQLSIIEIYTTEPTFVLDLGIILPVYWGCGVALLKKKEIGYKLTPILLVFIVIVGLTVIGQNIFQSSMGIHIPLRQLFGLVISFVVLGIVATILNVKFLRYLKMEQTN